MSNSRPLPEYGEYATPEQQAAAMGREYIPPPDPATRVAVDVPGPGAGSAPGVAPMGNLIDRFVTIFQLGIALVSLIASDYFHLAESTNAALEKAGVSLRVPSNIDHFGWLILVVNALFLTVTFAWSYAALRRGRLAFYIPFVGYLAFLLAVAILIAILF